MMIGIHVEACLISLVSLATACLSVRAENAELRVTDLGRIASSLAARDEQRGTDAKWAKVGELLKESANRVVVKQLGADLGGNTSARNEVPLQWKDDGYFRRARDLGQVFIAPRDFTLDAIVLRTGPSYLAFLPGAAGAEVFVQFFEVTGQPVINDNGTPAGTPAKHGFSTNHRCDDYLEGVRYKPLRVVRGGRLPDLAAKGDGTLIYLKWAFTARDAPKFDREKRYAFMVGFVAPEDRCNFTLANSNNAGSPLPPTLNDSANAYHGGWAIRREGNGINPPRMVPADRPPKDAEVLQQLQAEAAFPASDARYAISPTTRGFPDVDTYRDLEFYLIERPTDDRNDAAP